MHRPPAVTWSVRPARWHAGALISLTLLATLLLIGFIEMQGWGDSSLALLLLLAASAILAFRRLRSAPVGQLNWDGEQWHWSDADAQAVESMACVLDLQTRILVRIVCESRTHHWLWLECSSPDVNWFALRRAIFASKRVDAVAPGNNLADG
jgi:hypothetical protein